MLHRIDKATAFQAYVKQLQLAATTSIILQLNIFKDSSVSSLSLARRSSQDQGGTGSFYQPRIWQKDWAEAVCATWDHDRKTSVLIYQT